MHPVLRHNNNKVFNPHVQLCRHCHSKTRGMTLIEILLAIVLMAILLTATAVTFDAAFKSYKVNNDLARTSTVSRNAVYQMCSVIRTAANSPDTALILVNADGTSCCLVDSLGRDVIYAYDAVNKTLKVNIDSSDTWYIMARNIDPVDAVTPIFTAWDPLDDSLPAGTVGKVEIAFRASSCDASQIVTMSAIPRNVIYH